MGGSEVNTEADGRQTSHGPLPQPKEKKAADTEVGNLMKQSGWEALIKQKPPIHERQSQVKEQSQRPKLQKDLRGLWSFSHLTNIQPVI
jgi:hypothetical protein